MINVTHDEPFQFRANVNSIHALRNDSGSVDVASDSPSHGSYASFPEDENDHQLYSPDGLRRGRHADRHRRRGRRTSPLVPMHNGHGHRGNGSSNFAGSGGSSSGTRRPVGPRTSTSAAGPPHMHGNGNGNINTNPSRSSSRDGSFRSGYSNYSYDDDYDNGYRRRYEDYDDDSFDREEEAHMRRLRGPKLNVQILALPARQIELEEEEERIRKEEAEYARGDGVNEDEGELTPVQERTSMSMSVTPRPEPNLQVASVEPLNQEDHDAVRSHLSHGRTCSQRGKTDHPAYQIVALGDALWKALEDGLRITEPPKIIHGWED